MRLTKIYLAILFWLSSLSTSYAATEQQSNQISVGGMANSLLEPVGVFTDLMYKICYIIGAAMVMGSFIQYRAYRQNPLQVPISRPIMLFIIGGVLIAIPFITQLSSGASATT